MGAKFARNTFIALALIGLAGSAQAALMSEEVMISDCDAMGCEGSTLYLKVEEDITGGFTVTYTINVEDYTGDRIGFNQVGFKVISGWTEGDQNYIISAPVGSMTADWSDIFDDPINSDNSLCDSSSGDTDKVCTFGFVGGTDTADFIAGGEYTWVIYIAEGTMMDVNEWHLGAQYANSQWRHPGHIISAQVPEPTAALLFGLGAFVVTRAARRH
jgi:hypothetical protein